MEQIRLLRQDEIECRIGMINEKGISLLLYKDARVDMKILDEVYGPTNWQRSHVMIGENLYCTVSIWDDAKKQWISKMDVGTESYTEKEKGQASDSFKRACTVLGIGRELYSAGFIWVPASKVNIQKRGDKYCTYDKFSVRHISYNEKREIAGLVIANQDGNIVYTLKDSSSGKTGLPEGKENNTGQGITEEKTAAIHKELARTGVALDTVLRRYGVSSIGEMSAATYRSAMNSLKKTKDKEKAA